MKKNLITLSLLFLCIVSFAQVTNSCILPNAGFELGSTSGWILKSGDYGINTPCPAGTCPRYGTNYSGGAVAGPLNAPLGGATNRHTLMSAAGGNDPNATTPAVPVVAPGGGIYSFRLGNGITGSGAPNRSLAEAARLTFLVTNQNAFFTYRYSFFVKDGSHGVSEQPGFEVVVLDQNDTMIPCGRFFVVPGNYPNCVNGAGFVNGLNGYVYKPWTDVGLDLTGYIGQNISIEFRTTDCLPIGGTTSTSCSNGICTLTNAAGTCTYIAGQPPCTPTGTNCVGSPGTHSAYAYIDAYCSPLSVVTPVFCAGSASVQICAPTGYQSYSWPAGQPGLSGSPTTQCVNITNPVAGTTYTVNMVSVTGCVTKTTIKLTGFDLTLRDTTICTGAAAFPLTLAPLTPGTYNYTWTPAAGLSCTNCQSPTYSPGSSSTSYTVTMEDPSSGCTTTKVINITIAQSTSATATATICNGASIPLTATGSITYTWSPATGLSSTSGASVIANPIVTTTYTVKGTSAAGCISSTTIVVTVDQIAVASFIANPLTGAPPLLVNFTNNSTNASTYFWNFGNGLTSTLTNPSTTYINTGSFPCTLIAYSSSGRCNDTVSVDIIIEDPFSILIPNVFSPNNDNINDLFQITSLGFSEMNVIIYNRWGKLLYKYDGLNNSWDGTVSGKPVPDGVYYYILEGKTKKSEKYNKSGFITLIR